MKDMAIQKESLKNIRINRGQIKFIQIQRIHKLQLIGSLSNFHFRHLIQCNGKSDMDNPVDVTIRETDNSAWIIKQTEMKQSVTVQMDTGFLLRSSDGAFSKCFPIMDITGYNTPMTGVFPFFQKDLSVMHDDHSRSESCRAVRGWCLWIMQIV